MTQTLYIEGIIVDTERPREHILRFTLKAPEIAKKAKAGQFVMIKALNGHFMQPFSIAMIYPPYLDFFIQIKGAGTKQLASLSPGSKLDCLGPLGTSWQENVDFENVKDLILVAGGIGFPPLLCLLKSDIVKGKKVSFFYGVKTEIELVKMPLSIHVTQYIATDDGSQGYMGNIIGLLKSKHTQNKPTKTVILACGPHIMLKVLFTDYLKPSDIEGYVSLEARMACGTGVCQGCVIKTTNGEKPYLRVCKDGPIFPAELIDWFA